MIPVPQRTTDDCVRAAFASVLEMAYEELPDFRHEGVPWTSGDGTIYKAHGLDGARMWMRQAGWPITTREVRYFRPMSEIEAMSDEERADPLNRYAPRKHPPHHGGWWIGIVISENIAGSTHAIVMHGGGVAFDPCTTPRRTPYQFVGEITFVAEDPSVLWPGWRA